MRFRLPAGTFPELELAKEDMDNMEDVAAMIVDSAIDEFERLRLDNNGLADKRWKPIKRKAGVMLYEDRSMPDRTDALDVAIDEIRRASPLLAAESGMAVTSASSLFSLINSDKFDRDCFFHSYQ
ncbi:hypothetical protein KRP22_005592 [Phytophthora ramorum]|nr:hypothetical protein KRP22_3276 [Phytophthora ramorum]